MVSLTRAISKLGLASRAAAEAMIGEGRVKVGGRVVRSPAHRVDPDRDAIEVDGERVARARPVYLMLHKPEGYVTTRRDPEGRPTVYDLLPAGTPYVSAVGRLDLDSSGLLLLSNDTRWAEAIARPGAGARKTYRVTLDRPLDAALARELERGVVLGGKRTRPCTVSLGGAASPREAEVTLSEGRNRQVRRMLEAVGRKVERLVRIRIGRLELGDLAPGACRPLSPGEVGAFR